jgi:hypothetical protein
MVGRVSLGLGLFFQKFSKKAGHSGFQATFYIFSLAATATLALAVQWQPPVGASRR